MSAEKDKEKETPSEPSTDETQSETVTEDVKMSDDKEKMIPKKRFDEINTAKKELEAQLAAVKERQSVGVLEWQRPEKNSVNHAEDGCIRADAECQTEDDYGREARTLGHHAEPKTNVLPQASHSYLNAVMGSTLVALRAGM